MEESQGAQAPVNFDEIQKILAQLQETVDMVSRRTTLLGKRIRAEMECEDLTQALEEVKRLEKAYLEEATASKKRPCWFEYVATHEAGTAQSHKN
jgi:GTP-sensing pleiotropic transcriptional regulator CodY